MERLGGLPYRNDGENFGDSYKNVDTADDVIVLYKDVISFVAEKEEVSLDDLHLALTEDWGHLSTGVVFSRGSRGNLELWKGRKKAFLDIFDSSHSAAIIKSDSSGKTS